MGRVRQVSEIKGVLDRPVRPAERHHDQYSILRRTIAPANALQDALRQRAVYATILHAAGAVELARCAQEALDTGNAILRDAVLRENGGRSRAGQPFVTGELLKRIPNAEPRRHLGYSFVGVLQVVAHYLVQMGLEDDWASSGLTVRRYLWERFSVVSTRADARQARREARWFRGLLVEAAGRGGRTVKEGGAGFSVSSL